MKQLSAILVCSCHLYVALAGIKSRLFARGITNMRRGHPGLNATLDAGRDESEDASTNLTLIPLPGCGGKLGKMIYLGWEREFYTFQPCGSQPRAILITIHCLGCTPGHAWDPYLQDAESNGFILIAPQGYNASFNAATYCCGTAMDLGLDDKGFIKSLVNEIDQGRRLPVFATGVSNGGYMASSLAVAFPGWLTGVAAAAGHVYHGLFHGLHGTAVMIMWDEQDVQVRHSGCCRDITKPRCCCGLSETGPPKCTSAQEMFFAWKRANGCTATKSVKDPLGVKGACQSGVGCKYPVEFCMFHHWEHSEWIVFPRILEKKVFNFFLDQLKKNDL